MGDGGIRTVQRPYHGESDGDKKGKNEAEAVVTKELFLKILNTFKPLGDIVPLK